MRHNGPSKARIQGAPMIKIRSYPDEVYSELYDAITKVTGDSPIYCSDESLINHFITEEPMLDSLCEILEVSLNGDETFPEVLEILQSRSLG